ncbi:MAG: hypothetical protein WAT09_16675 [Paracoccaceae bacterium]
MRLHPPLAAILLAACLPLSAAWADTSVLPLPDPPLANDPPLTADEFDAMTLGKTMDTHSSGGSYGVEKFLPGKRSIWEDARGCMYGTWEQVGNQICFTYEDDPANPDCWTYHARGDALKAWYFGDRSNEPIMLYPSDLPMTCNEYLGT